MKLHPDCFSCVLRMSIESLRMIYNDDNIVFNDVVRDVFAQMQIFNESDTSPEIISKIQRMIKDKTGVSNPYGELKKRDLNVAENIVNHLDAYYQNESTLDIKTTLLISAIGNTLDSGVSLKDQLSNNIEAELNKGFALYDGEIFVQKLNRARSVLILGDNIAEAVLDQFLIKKLKPRHLVYSVRGCAILNDVAVEDVDKVAVEGVEYLSTGSDICGIVLSECSKDFRTIFNSADIIISKGMGNYETLSSQCTRDVFYLLKAKCLPMAKEHGVNLDDYVLRYSPITMFS